MHEIGVVVARQDDGTVVVEVDRTSACEGCHARGACQTTLQPRKARVTASDPLGALVGQRVRLEMTDGGFLGACAQVFLVPLAGLAVGAATAFALAEWAGWSAGQDLAAALGALLGVVWGFARLRGLELRMRKSGDAAASRYQVWISAVYS